MAKKKSAAGVNMSKAIRDLLSANPKFSLQQAMDAMTAKYPAMNINKGSFSVAFYTGRQKLGIVAPGRGKKSSGKKSKTMSTSAINLHALQTAARFLSEVGGADAAMQAIRQVQALQVK